MSTTFPSRTRALGALTALVLIGLSVRAPVTSLPAVLGDIQGTFDLSPTAAGLLTSLPVLCFGIGAAGVSALARRFGINRLMIMSLIVLTVLVWVRPFTGAIFFFLATIGIGLAISAGNVLLPVIVRRDFAHRQGPVLSAVSSAMPGGAAIAAIGTIPLWLAFGWQWALALWGVLTLAATICYAAFTGHETPAEGITHATRIWKIPGAWAMSVFFGLNSGLFYANTHWLPTLIPELTGASEAEAGLAASIFQFGGLLGAVAVPLLVTRIYQRQIFATALSGLWVIYAVGLIFAPQLYLLWMVPGALAQGGVFALLLSLYVLRSPDLGLVRDLSGMTQTFGYFISALAPVSIGALYEFSGSWIAPLSLMAAMALALVLITPIVSTRKKLATG